MKNRIQFHLGYLMMVLALMIPLVTFGRMVWQHQVQFQQYEQYEAQASTQNSDEIQEASRVYNERLNSENSIVDPFLAEGYQADYGVLENPNAIYGYLSIPSLELVEPVYLGASLEHMAIGLGHVDGTSLPLEGEGVRSVIAGHRGEPNHVFFRHLDKLSNGDKLYFDNGGEIVTYEMVSSEIILPSEWEKLLPVKNENWITLITCDPIPLYNKRLLVNFQRVDSYKKGTATEKKNLQQAFARSGQVISKVSVYRWIYNGTSLLSLVGILCLVRRYLKYFKGTKRNNEE